MKIAYQIQRLRLSEMYVFIWISYMGETICSGKGTWSSGRNLLVELYHWSSKKEDKLRCSDNSRKFRSGSAKFAASNGFPPCCPRRNGNARLTIVHLLNSN